MITFDQIPEDRIVADYLGERFNIAAAKDRVGGHHRFSPMTIKNAVNAPALYEEVWRFYHQVGVVNWQSRDNVALYGSSLYYNPAHERERWHTGSFGTPRFRGLSDREYQDAPVHVEKYGGGKNDYVDIYAFRKQHPFIAQHMPHMRALLDSFNFPITRVTARTLNGLFPIGGSYHIDTKDAFHVRLNICLSTDGSFGLSYKNGATVMFDPGDAHMVCTAHHHSAYASRLTNFQRTNLIIDVIPWYRYDADADGWEPNEYFGRIHPYDMVAQGIISFGAN